MVDSCELGVIVVSAIFDEDEPRMKFIFATSFIPIDAKSNDQISLICS